LSELAPKYVAKAKKLVRAEFPEMAGAEPSIDQNKARSKDGTARSVFVLTFKKSIPLPDGGQLRRVVRVTMDQEGEVIKLSASK
jgi:hypothetical protein